MLATYKSSSMEPDMYRILSEGLSSENSFGNENANPKRAVFGQAPDGQVLNIEVLEHHDLLLGRGKLVSELRIWHVEVLPLHKIGTQMRWKLH
jgi:hypothetical protein